MRDTWYVIDFILCLWIWLDFFRIYQRRYRITLDRWLFSYYRFFIIVLFFDQWNGFSFNRSIFTFCVLCSYDRDPQGPQCNNSLSDICLREVFCCVSTVLFRTKSSPSASLTVLLRTNPFFRPNWGWAAQRTRSQQNATFSPSRYLVRGWGGCPFILMNLPKQCMNFAWSISCLT